MGQLLDRVKNKIIEDRKVGFVKLYGQAMVDFIMTTPLKENFQYNQYESTVVDKEEGEGKTLYLIFDKGYFTLKVWDRFQELGRVDLLTKEDLKEILHVTTT